MIQPPPVVTSRGMSRLLDELIAARAIEDEKQRRRRSAKLPPTNGNGYRPIPPSSGVRRDEEHARRHVLVDDDLRVRAIAREMAARCHVGWYDLEAEQRRRWVALALAALAAIAAVDGRPAEH